MQENERIYLDATLLSVIKDGVFRAQLDNGHRFVAYSRGEPGDLRDAWRGRRVGVQMSPYDMSKGLILDKPEN